jgi:hypothetical protein
MENNGSVFKLNAQQILAPQAMEAHLASLCIDLHQVREHVRGVCGFKMQMVPGVKTNSSRFQLNNRQAYAGETTSCTCIIATCTASTQQQGR